MCEEGRGFEKEDFRIAAFPAVSLPLERRVPVVLDGVLAASGDGLGDVAPPVAHAAVGLS